MEFPERMSILVRILIGSLTFLTSYASFADIHGILTGTTNYVGRGYTKTQNDFAIQGNLDYQHESGVYLGASVSNINFGDRNFNDSSRVEFAPYLGYTHKLADDWHVDLQWTRYVYEGKIFGQDVDYNEFYAFLHYRDLLTLRVAISDSFYNQNNVTSDYELTGRYPLTEYLEISTGVGYSQVEKVLEYDYLYWNTGITWRYKFVAADLRYMHAFEATTLIKAKDPANWEYEPEVIHATFVFSLSVGF